MKNDIDYLVHLIETGHDFIGGLWHEYPSLMGALNNLVKECVDRSTCKFIITWDKNDIPEGLEEVFDFFDNNGFHYYDNREKGSTMYERTIYFNLGELIYHLRRNS